MSKKLHTILLIDDSEADNFIHTRRLQKAGVADQIVVKYNGKQALEYLSSLSPSVPPLPELIFLDINMPVMNGWEFLDAYQALNENQRGRTLVTMLTTSAADTDRKRAEQYSVIDKYLEKPLTKQKLNAILEEYFPDYR